MKALLLHKHTSENHAEYKNDGSLKLNLLVIQENILCSSEVNAIDLPDIDWIIVPIYVSSVYFLSV